MREDAEKSQERMLKLEKYLRKRGDNPYHFKYGVSYFISSKESRNSELNEFLRKYVNLDAFKSGKILSVGCGMGGFLAYLQENGFEAYGIDIETDIVKIAFAKDVLVADAQVLPFNMETFDIVIGIDVIEHLENQKSAIQNILSKIKPKGKLILLTNNRLFPFDSDTKLFFINYMPNNLANRYLRLLRGNPNIQYDNKTPTYFRFAKLCENRGKYKIKVDGIFTVFGYYVERFRRLKRIATIIEIISHRWRLLQWIQWFAPKLCLVIQKP